MNTDHLDTTNPAPFSVPRLINTFRTISADQHSAIPHAHVTAADLSAPFLRSQQQEQAMVQALRDAALNNSDHSVATADHFWLLAAIRARKGDLVRAHALASNFIQWRASFFQQPLSPAQLHKMHQQLARKIVFVSGNVDKQGRPILNLRPRNHDPSQFSATDSLRMITFVLEWTLRTYPAAQTQGIVFLNDMSGASFTNLDVRIPGVMQKAFANNLPVRLAAINLVKPPLLLKVVVSVIVALLGNKLKARIRIFGHRDEHRLLHFIDRHHIIDDIGMGGTASWTEQQHQAWVQRIIQDCKAWTPVVEPSS